jgi:SAM-dependent methyltransferase
VRWVAANFHPRRLPAVPRQLPAGDDYTVADDEGYLLNNQQAEAGERFDAMAALFDPVTFRHLAAIGVSTGMRCWEVGAGGSTVPTWLAARVGPRGHVVATDIDTSWLIGTDAGFEVVRHDVSTDDPPAGEFDVVHCRLVLTHLPQRGQALRRMLQALRPGGWILLEDADPLLQPLSCPDEHGPAQQLANRLRQGFRTLLADRGADLAFGRTLPRLLRDASLENVLADAFFPITSPECTALELATIRQIESRLIDAGIATDAEIAEHLNNVATGTMDLATAPLISAWGRKSA